KNLVLVRSKETSGESGFSFLPGGAAPVWLKSSLHQDLCAALQAAQSKSPIMGLFCICFTGLSPPQRPVAVVANGPRAHFLFVAIVVGPASESVFYSRCYTNGVQATAVTGVDSTSGVRSGV